MSDPQNSDRLRRLLALKRHELPPPVFFELLPRKIRAQLERESSRRSSFTAWWRRLALEWDLKPALAGFALIAAGGLYFMGIEPASGTAADPATIGQGPAYAAFFQPPPPVLDAEPFSDEGDEPSLRPRLSVTPPPGLFSPVLAVETATHSGGSLWTDSPLPPRSGTGLVP